MVDFTLWDIFRNLLLAARWTVLLSLIAFIGGGLVGLGLLLARLARWPGAQTFVAGYVQLFQGTPLLMQLFLAYFGLALFGINVSAWVAASVALTLYTSAFLTEIWRGCVNAIPKGQWEAAETIGYNYAGALRRIILPQATRVAVPPLSNTLISLVKDTSLASTILVTELLRQAQIVAAPTFEFFALYGTAAIYYWVICLVLWFGKARVKRRLERYVAR